MHTFPNFLSCLPHFLPEFRPRHRLPVQILRSRFLSGSHLWTSAIVNICNLPAFFSAPCLCDLRSTCGVAKRVWFVCHHVPEMINIFRFRKKYQNISFDFLVSAFFRVSALDTIHERKFNYITKQMKPHHRDFQSSWIERSDHVFIKRHLAKTIPRTLKGGFFFHS